MTSAVCVNFHCHSIFSDGDQTPEALAANFSRAGVRFASLTDHDTLEGLPRFAEAAHKYGVVTLPGLELTTWHDGAEIHILAYGFDSENLELLSVLHDLRQGQTLEVHSIAGSLRKKGTNTTNHEVEVQADYGNTPKKLPTAKAIEIIHRAGGKSFLAHPLASIPDPEKLESLVIQLKSCGLDGIEVFYDPFTAEQQKELYSLAEKLDLLTSAGTDIHTNNGVLSIEFPHAEWKKFRNAVLSGQHSLGKSEPLSGNPGSKSAAAVSETIKKQPFQTRTFILRILLPTLIAIGLFMGAIWVILLPSFEQTLLDRKRELIRELTNSAWSILSSYEQDVQSGELELDEAQGLALDRIEALRYGPEAKDYFWVQDLLPTMLMHPYRPDLNGQDVSSFKDARGVPIFVEFANLVQRDEQGYINYVWQWKDDPARLEPKQSYVKGFKPWGWVIGTGIYTDDVNLEITKIERSIVNTSLIISGAVILLLLYVVSQSMKIDRERQGVVNSLRESTEKYHSLIEATTEGALLVMDGRCQYANPIFQIMTGYSSRQMDFLELEDMVPKVPENVDFWNRYDGLARQVLKPTVEKLEPVGIDGILRDASGGSTACVFTLNAVDFAGQNGLILLAKEISPVKNALSQDLLAGVMQAVPVGIFRARNSKTLKILAMNASAREYFSSPEPSLEDLFVVQGEFEKVKDQLNKGESIQDHIIQTLREDGLLRYLSLSAVVSEVEEGETRNVIGALRDVTAEILENQQREQIQKGMQSSLLFLHQSVGVLEKKYLKIDSQCEVFAAANLMAERASSVAFVTRGEQIVGVVTIRDLSVALAKPGFASSTLVADVMRLADERVDESVLVYEALGLMTEKKVEHLVVEDSEGKIENLIGLADMIHYQNYSPILLKDEISKSTSPQEIARNTSRVALIASILMESSSRPGPVTRLISSISDAVTQKLIQLALDDLGPAPTPFVFVAMGSQGRMEQTLLTDQDNGIIYLEGTDANGAYVSDYYHKLGQRVCKDLAESGYPYCNGGVMADHPKWCQTLTGWVESFKKGVRAPEPQEVIDLNIFLDFRPIFGDVSITETLRQEVLSIVKNDSSVFLFLAKGAINFKIPSKVSGGSLFSVAGMERADEINLKDAMMPIVAFARLYALRDRIQSTHTLERIQVLSDRGVVTPSSRDEIIAVYNFLMQTRLEVQRNAIKNHNPITNNIKVNELGYLQRELLKQSLVQIEAIQKKINFDFMGGMG